MAAARLVVNFSKRVQRRPSAIDNRKFANRAHGNHATSGVRDVDYADTGRKCRGAWSNNRLTGQNTVCNTSQKQIAALGADERRSKHDLVGQRLLDGDTVLVDLLRYRVIGSISTRLILPVVRVAQKGRGNYVRILRKAHIAEGGTNAVRLNRLNLIFSLTRTVVNTEPAAKNCAPTSKESI